MGGIGTALRLHQRTTAVAEYQRDAASPGRPVGTMLAGGALAVVSAVLCARLGFAIWYLHDVQAQYGLFGVSFLFALFVLGCYFFCLAYELYDVPRALRLTLAFAILGVLALAFMAAVLLVLASIQGSAAVAVSETQRSKVLGAVTAIGGSETEDDGAGGRHGSDLPGFSMVTCKHCDRDFFPVPPSAVCPWCNTPYLTDGYPSPAQPMAT